MGEPEFLSLLRSRDQRGLDELLHICGPLMRYIIRPILPDDREQEECISDAALRVWEKIDTYDPARGSFTTWLTVLTRNAALNRARKSEPEHRELTPDLPAPDSDPEQQLLKKERLWELRQVLSGLSDGERSLLYRKYYYRQPTAQIARELGTTERAVEGRLYRLKSKLKKLLGGERYG